MLKVTVVCIPCASGSRCSFNYRSRRWPVSFGGKLILANAGGVIDFIMAKVCKSLTRDHSEQITNRLILSGAGSVPEIDLAFAEK